MTMHITFGVLVFNIGLVSKIVSEKNFDSLFANSAVKLSAEVHPIPETELYTGMYYKLGLERFPYGCVTWTETLHPVGGWSYMQIDASSENWINYQKDGAWYNDAQWFFAQVDESLGWYTLRNRQLPNNVATINRDVKNGSEYYIVLKEVENPVQSDALWKPVTVLKNDTDLYKLVVKSEPEAPVSWSFTLVSPNVSDSYFLQVDVNPDPKHRGRYGFRGDWFVDTLFRFEPVDKELIYQLQNASVNILSKTVQSPASVKINSNITNMQANQFWEFKWAWQALPVLFVVLCFIFVSIYLVKRHISKTLLFADEMTEFFNGVKHNSSKSGTDIALSFEYDKARYEIASSLYQIDKTKCLGSGEFGIVYSGVLLDGQVNVAVKTLKRRSRELDKSSCTALKGLISEIKILSYLGAHKNIIKLYGANTKGLKSGSVYVFLELCKLGSLASYLRNPIRTEYYNVTSSVQNCTKIDNEEIMRYSNLKSHLSRWSQEIADGMEFLASKQLVHADLATRNVLLDSDKTAKISDFGLSRRLYDYTHYIKTSQEPLPWRWMAPEALRKNEFCEKTDVWAYGVTLWEIYTLGDTPYPGLTWDVNFPTMLERGLKPGIPKYNEGNMYQIMLQCWAVNPEKRPTFSTLTNSLKLASKEPYAN